MIGNYPKELRGECCRRAGKCRTPEDLIYPQPRVPSRSTLVSSETHEDGSVSEHYVIEYSKHFIYVVH
jgi:hypothetical protein